ncbi:MAG: glycosyltransferase [Thermoanaerobaculia bacterium]
MTFYLPGEAQLDRLRELDPDRDWRELVRGEHAWVLQTFLRLRAAGYEVELAEVPPSRGLVIYHAKHGRLLARHLGAMREAVLVGIRADLREPLTADFQVVQNHVFVDGRRCFYVPLWPQPDLLPRESSRGTEIGRIAFKGFVRNLHPAFHGPFWRQALEQRGIRWELDATGYNGTATCAAELNWRDFREVDLVLAVRPADHGGHRNKPATKLYNAWAAGVPALLGPEPAYRELRQSELDYFEVRTPEEAVAAVDRLRQDSGLYRAMVENGQRRRAAFAAEEIVGMWAEVLFEQIPALVDQRPLQAVPPRLRPLVRRAQRAFSGRPAR